MNRRVLIPLEIAPARPAPDSRVHALDGSSMGTSWSVRIAAPALDGAGLQAALQAELDQIVAEMSHWEGDSVLSRFNRAAAGSWHKLPARFAQVIDAALALAQLSQGAYDPAAGALINAWGFGPGEAYAQPGYQPPDAAQCAALAGGWHNLRWTAGQQRLFQAGGVQLDLSSIAKGYAVDRMAELLLGRGHQHFVCEAGGELRAHGMKPDGEPWWVSLENPPGAALPDTLLALHGMAVASSGDYLRARTLDGRLLSHTLDPRTRQPIAHGLAAVSVLHSSCMQADALSTALMVMGSAAGMAFAEQYGMPARFVQREPEGMREQCTSAWEALAA